MKKSQGFTLVELMVVVIIVGILAAVVTHTVSGIKNRAIATEALGMLGAVESACRTFALANGAAPTSVEDLKNAGIVNLASLDGTFFTHADIAGLVGDGNIPIGNKGLLAGSGQAKGITIQKTAAGGYAVSGKYQP